MKKSTAGIQIVTDAGMVSGGNCYTTDPTGEFWDYFDSPDHAEMVINEAVGIACDALDWGAIAAHAVNDYLKLEGVRISEQATNAIVIEAIQAKQQRDAFNKEMGII